MNKEAMIEHLIAQPLAEKWAAINLVEMILITAPDISVNRLVEILREGQKQANLAYESDSDSFDPRLLRVHFAASYRDIVNAAYQGVAAYAAQEVQTN